ncbi:malonate transporter subunit MadL [Allorhizobium taibaishanense]|uniref:Malonate transporter MadL subunit n=1 Tax=Allorhizobium taibaishanense TaxID=887144 RepID=A0A1Q9A6X0_9HYPH|nr:malonate transporter subunit MadL [Allorhizobium taibaishanense]MBB4008516.1 malonate transporter MadL subunit [Allorhizobium taibaishanense]OLP50326.1 malonate transporter subunit MadL [Allorhizobium taibaishanense]
MVIFGTALLAACYLIGVMLGEGIAILIGVKANVGGVGIAMILLIACIHRMQKLGWYVPETAKGVTFWAAMYIPVVVAMASTQNVIVAVKSGPLALLAAVLTFLTCFFFVGVINRVIERNHIAADPFGPVDDAAAER